MGSIEGDKVGFKVGSSLGLIVGESLGLKVGKKLGEADGFIDIDGVKVGAHVKPNESIRGVPSSGGQLATQRLMPVTLTYLYFLNPVIPTIVVVASLFAAFTLEHGILLTPSLLIPFSPPSCKYVPSTPKVLEPYTAKR